MANGILIVDKPQGWTSQDVVSKLRGVYHERRVGHGGTLDPMATGVLPLFFGRATRAVEFFEHAEKAYVATVRFGQITDTQDITGTVLEERSARPEKEELETVLRRFLGPQEQLPPMYSAIKVGGKKLYDLARRGQEVERKKRSITVFALELLEFNKQEAKLYIHCSKGTYVRTLCHDLGQALGCGGCMATLRRVRAGEYAESQSHTLEEILSHPDPESLLLPTDSLFRAHPALTLTAPQEKCVRNGAAFTYFGKEGSYRLYSQGGEFLALAQVREGKLSTVKSFFEV